MADSLVLKGAKSVTKHTGSDMILTRPKRGGDTHLVPQWWNLKGKVLYVPSAIFRVNSSKGALALVVPVDKENSEVTIKHDGDGNFTFIKPRGIDRVAVMAADLSVFYEEYQFAKISGGPTLKRTVNPLPEGAPAFLDLPTISGSLVDGETLAVIAALFTGGDGATTTQLLIQSSTTGVDGWTTAQGFPGTDPGAAVSYTIPADAVGKYFRVRYEVTDANETVSVNSAVIGPVESSFATRQANATFSYTVDINNIGTYDLPQNVYTLNGVDGPGIAGSVGDSFYFDFSAVASNHPLAIFTDASKTTPVTVGVYTEGDALIFEPPIAGTFSYQCINHPNMGGTITVS